MTEEGEKKMLDLLEEISGSLKRIASNTSTVPKPPKKPRTPAEQREALLRILPPTD